MISKYELTLNFRTITQTSFLVTKATFSGNKLFSARIFNEFDPLLVNDHNFVLLLQNGGTKFRYFEFLVLYAKPIKDNIIFRKKIVCWNLKILNKIRHLVVIQLMDCQCFVLKKNLKMLRYFLLKQIKKFIFRGISRIGFRLQ